jgi:NO-binding membrane sensor protein with MHYT domain/nitrogen-specific signal transduction histidine kinase
MPEFAVYRVLSCLTTQHDYRLVFLAAIICGVAAITSFSIYSRAVDRSGLARLGWLCLTGFFAACGIWATHFVAMLAYDAGTPTAYQPVWTTASLLIAAIATTAGFSVAALGGRLRAALGGALIGAGIGVMHFTGMKALIVAGTIQWDMPIVAASLLFGAALASAAMVVFQQLTGQKAIAAAAGLLTLAICGLHFTAMGAALVIPDPTVVVPPSQMTGWTLATALTGITLLILHSGLAVALLDRRAQVARQMQEANAKLLEANESLQAAESAARRAEAEARAFAVQLREAHRDVTSLNEELAIKIEKLREAQDEIVKKGKLAQLGQLTATVAHEIRNPLGAVRTAAFLVERKTLGKGLGLEPQLQRINNGITRCDRIITELLDFARTTKLVCKTEAVDDWLRQVVEEEAKELPALVEVTCELGLGDTTSAFDAGRMRRVVINLLSNAAEAMVGKGADASCAATANPKICVATQRAGDTIEITVTDNGPGIPEENLQKILEPLFSTKSFGTGLGLPAVEKILEHHGGGLRINSKLGEGTAMTAWFPLAQRERKAA